MVGKRGDGGKNKSSLDEDMPDASNSLGTQRSLVNRNACVESGSTGESVSGPLEVPRANGKHTSGTAKHRKTVSFVMNGGDAEAMLAHNPDAKSQSKMTPPLPPSPSLGGIDVQEHGTCDGKKSGANEAFLLRNFWHGGETPQVGKIIVSIYSLFTYHGYAESAIRHGTL